MVAASEREISLVAPRRLNNLHTAKNRIYQQIGPGVNNLTCIQDVSFPNLDWDKDCFGSTVVFLNPSGRRRINNLNSKLIAPFNVLHNSKFDIIHSFGGKGPALLTSLN